MRLGFCLLFLILSYSITSQTCSNDVMEYNGINNYINVGSSVGNNLRSIEFWFRPNVSIDSSTSASGYSFIIRNDATQFSEYGIYIRGTDWSGVGDVGRLCFFVRYSGTLHELMSNQNSWTAGTWYHVAGVIDNVSRMALYIDGILQTTSSPTATSATQSHASITTLGTWGDAYIRYFNGRMDEMRLWNRSLTQTEIQTKMCLHLNPSMETGLVAYWNFDEGSGTQIIDSTSNAFNGNIFGTSWINELYCPSLLTLNTIAGPTECDSNTGTATANPSNGISPYTYLWSNGQTLQTATGLGPGTYTVVATDFNGCTNSQTVQIDPFPEPQITVSSNVSIVSGNSITLSATGGTTYSWTPNASLSCSSCSDPIAFPLETTIYCVLATDTNGCSSNACVRVEVVCNKPFVPTAFSPNNDGQNDILFVFSSCIKTLDFAIFDRWGEKVFETTNVSEGWDGRFNGKAMDNAVFGYFLNAELTDGTSISKKGNIHLIK